MRAYVPDKPRTTEKDARVILHRVFYVAIRGKVILAHLYKRVYGLLYSGPPSGTIYLDNWLPTGHLGGTASG